MEQLISDLTQVILGHFHNAELDLQLIPGSSGRVSGFLATDDFEGVSQRERQRILWDFLRKNVGIEEQQKVSSVLTLTTGEKEAFLEDVNDTNH